MWAWVCVWVNHCTEIISILSIAVSLWTAHTCLSPILHFYTYTIVATYYNLFPIFKVYLFSSFCWGYYSYLSPDHTIHVTHRINSSRHPISAIFTLRHCFYSIARWYFFYFDFRKEDYLTEMTSKNVNNILPEILLDTFFSITELKKSTRVIRLYRNITW